MGAYRVPSRVVSNSIVPSRLRLPVTLFCLSAVSFLHSVSAAETRVEIKTAAPGNAKVKLKTGYDAMVTLSIEEQ